MDGLTADEDRPMDETDLMSCIVGSRPCFDLNERSHDFISVRTVDNGSMGTTMVSCGHEVVDHRVNKTKQVHMR
jgi:hypothetical protein